MARRSRPAAVAASLERFGATAPGDAVVISADRGLLLALSNVPISKTTTDGVKIGTGPFRVVTETASRAVFQANEDYWAGRPYLDAVEIDLGRSLRDQALDFDLNKADIVELGFADTRRVAQGGKRAWISEPVDLLALIFDAATDERVREAVALSIDRATIHSVLLQRQGVPAGSILPQWLSGYAFLFPAARDLEKARRLATAAPVTLGYDAGDLTARLIAERIALNAREAGITIRTTAGTQAAARIVRLRVAAPDPLQAILSACVTLNLKLTGTAYQIERAMLQGNRIVPLFHLPEIYGLGPRVRGWAPSRWGGWNLDSVWLAP